MQSLGQFALPLIIFVAIFYFLILRPQQKQKKQVQEMQSSLSRGDKIITIGGLQGTVESFDDQNIVLRSSGSKLSFERSAIRSIIKKSGSAAEEDSKKKDDKETTAEKE
ncbi:preprotein translocase subunit YajC [Sporolactobacillus shoreae]|uniref:Preprotein translocase subunit YajC n=1 Tax=Sporolactobacillus shoreae TaxID=1465501 RepID=A0A4Z0GTA2_9BACL|nr:preprotein translocase subunit YajC [Sporolactobacillus shoreae]TGA99506.1 preprotein translocase subunit YajC [Sporolactobacillus shoreae]